MRKLFVILLMIFTFVLALTSCQSESSLDDILALPEFEGFSAATADDIIELSKKYWLWNNTKKISNDVLDEVRLFMEKKNGTVSAGSVLKVDEELNELHEFIVVEFSSASWAQKAMNQCPSLKALGEENPDVQYLYGNCIVIKEPIKKLSPAKYPDIEAALLDAGFVEVQGTTVNDPLLLIPALGVADDKGKGTATLNEYCLS